MIITLKNFRCHKSATFEIPDEGLVMLSGKSRAGKTTILNGIVYALYGNIRKPYSHGTSSCSVKLTYKNIIVTRSNRPNKLVVEYLDETYEGEAAQGLIDKLMNASASEFMASSYIIQNKSNSVVSMTPTEQAKFIENLAFDGDDHKKYRVSIKEFLDSVKNELHTHEGKISVVEQNLSDIREEIEEFGEVEECEYTAEDIKKQKHEMHKKITVNTNTVKDLREIEKKLEAESIRNTHIEDKRKSLDIEISGYRRQLSELGTVLSEEEIQSHEDELAEKKSLLKNTELYAKCVALKRNIKKYESERSATQEKIKKKILSEEEVRDIKEKISQLNSSQSKISRAEAEEKYQTIFTEYKEKFGAKTICRIKKPDALAKFLERQIHLYETHVSTAQKKLTVVDEKLIRSDVLSKTYECPECHSHLRFEKECLRAVTDDTSDSTQPNLQEKKDELYRKLTNLENSLAKLQEFSTTLESIKDSLEGDTPEVDEDIETLQQKLAENAVYTEQLKNSSSKILQDMRVEFKKLVKYLPPKFKPSLTSQELHDQILELQKTIEEGWRKKSAHSSLSREISTREKKLANTTPSVGRMLKSDAPTMTLEKVRSKILELSNSIVEYTNNLKNISDYEEATHKISKLKDLRMIQQKLHAKLDELLTVKKSLVRDSESATEILKLSKEAEILAMTKTIESINEYAKFYLQELFEDTVVVRLESTKTTGKNTKTQINTSVFIRGEESSMDDLCGGEKQKIELAFLLAVSDMIGGPMILLDECLNNLDAEVNMDVLMYLKSLSSEKLILVISHEAIKGVFDHIINL